MTEPTDAKSRRLAAPGTMLAAACFLFAALFALAGCVPFSWLQPLGALVRRPDDVTPERYGRYLQICWSLAVIAVVLGAAGWRRRSRVDGFLARLGSELRFSINAGRAAGIVVAAGAALRLAYLDRPIAYDEAYSYLNFARFPVYVALSKYDSLNNHLLNTFFMHVSHQLWGQQEWALRLGVFGCGVLLLLVIYRWAGVFLGRGTALITTAMAAAAPALISYSTDARGYIFLVTAALVLDHALHCAARGDSPALHWLLAWLSIVLGFWAIPLMLYPAAAVLAWYVVEPLTGDRDTRHARVVQRLRSIAILVPLSGVGIALLYAPAYLFRGTEALYDDPIILPVGFIGWLTAIPPAWAAAFGWWTEGPIHWTIWLIAAAGGVSALRRNPAALGRLLAPFAITFVLMMLQQVAPPPRMFLFLVPWFFALAAQGIDSTLNWVTTRVAPRIAVAFAIVLAAAGFAAAHPVVHAPEDRAVYVSIPDAIDRLIREHHRQGDPPARLLAPLPTELPSIYYLVRQGVEMPVNGTPEPGESVWLLARPGQPPESTLQNGVVALADWDEKLSPWQQLAEFPNISLWVSTELRQNDRSSER